MSLSMMIDVLVAVLLLITIAYCFQLNRRLARLRSDESALRATISELITATEIAERAILGLKATAADCDQTLGRRMGEAEQMQANLDDQVENGKLLLNRISQIVETVNRPTPAPASGSGDGLLVASPERSQGVSPRSLQAAAAEAAARLKAARERAISDREAAA